MTATSGAPGDGIDVSLGEFLCVIRPVIESLNGEGVNDVEVESMRFLHGDLVNMNGLERDERQGRISSFCQGVMLAMATILMVVSLPIHADTAEDVGDVNAWMAREYRYIIVEQDVKDVLQEFGRNLSLPMEISREVKGQVKGRIQATTAREFLEQLCAANGLAWFFDGGVVHVTTREELTQRTFDLAGISGRRLMADIEHLGAGSPMQARLADGGAVLQAWGTEAWVEGVSRSIDRLRRPISVEGSSVTVFRGSVTSRTAE